MTGLHEMTIPLHPVHPAIDDQSIAHLVRIFYERARADTLIGPVFAAAVSDWDHHIARITDFWSSVVLKTGRYDGRPLPPHLKLKLEPEHFDRWLAIFRQTALELFPHDAAAIFIDRSQRIADSFEMAIATQAGHIPSPRHAKRF